MINRRLNRYIDLDRYPIHQLDSSRGRDLVELCQVMMAEQSACCLPEFLRDSAVSKLSSEITMLETVAHKVNYPSTLYGWLDNSGFPEGHPRSLLLQRQCRVISTDQLDQSGHCSTLFQFDELTEFVRRLLGYESLYRSECPHLSIQVNVMNSGESFGWHFDTNDGVVSFAVQEAERGGVFEYAPMIRSESKENYAGVARIVDGSDPPVQLAMAPGTFSLFMGRRSLHRVSPVESIGHSRQSLLYSYDRLPGMVFPEKTCERLMGRLSGPYLGQ